MNEPRLPSAPSPPTALTVLVRAWVILLALAVPGVAPAQDEPLPDPDAPGLSAEERLEALIARVDGERQRRGTLCADFVQTKSSPLLLEPEVSRGRLVLDHPDRARWDFDTPERQVVVVAEGVVATHHVEQGHTEVLEVGDRGDRMMAFFGGGSLADLEQRFHVEAVFPGDPDAPYRLTLTPKSRRLERRLAALEMVIDPHRFVPLEVEITTADGARTELVLDAADTCGDLDPALFDIEALAGDRGDGAGDDP